MLSADGKRVAFTTWIDGKNRAVVDGVVGEPFDFISWPPSMSDGGVLAFAARREAEQFCVVNGICGPAYAHVWPPIMSRDGATVAYAADNADGAFVVVGDRRGPSFRSVGHVALSEDGRRVAYTAEDADCHYFVVVDDRPGPAFERVTAPVISEDGRVVAYGARKDGRWRIIAGDREIPMESEISSVFVSPRGDFVGGVLEEHRSFAVATERGHSHGWTWVDRPFFTPDGRATFLAARVRGKVFVIGDRQIGLADGVYWDPALSPDGTQVFISAKIGSELRRLTVPFR